MSVPYTYWILPDANTQSMLQAKVDELAEKYGGPTFEPHLTLLGDFSTDKDLVVSNATRVAEKLTGLRLSFGKVEFSTTYFQNVFVRVNATAALMDGYVFARDLFGIDTSKFFMPHISLFYGDTPMSKREEIARSITIDPIEWKAAKFVVNPSTPDPKGWEHIVEIDIE